jgi:hypothetical protein
MSNVQQSQSNLLAQERGLTQAGANLLPQVGGVQEAQGVGAAGELAGQLTTSMSEKILGQTSEVKQGEFTQPGIVTPRFFDKETGKMVDAGGNEIAPPPPVVNTGGGAQWGTGRRPKTLLDGGGPGVGGADNGMGGGNDTGGMGGGNSAGNDGIGTDG